jgi:maltooligosyltrehalose trehalohydrolase
MTYPYFGALPHAGGVRFRVWAPAARHLTLVLHGGPAAGEHPVAPASAPGLYEAVVPGIGAGQRYTYRIDGGDLRPDPASRFQPEGVHGPSEVVDPATYTWNDAGWTGIPPRDLVFYELHVGTFTPEGTYAAAAARLPALRDLGVTAIELMPIADFPGQRNWGYDGVALFAPARPYGRPEDLRRFVDAAHRLGLAVFLDVVYNHLGPEGAYVMVFNPQHLTDRHETPWGRAVNLDGPDSLMIRQFLIDNALHWVREYHLDGLRLDATHALIDRSPRHLLHELTHTVREHAGRPVVLIAEDHRNLARLVQDELADGWGLDGVWADDFHHVVRRMVAGDAHGYYGDFEGTAEELARTLRQGWLYTGQFSRHSNRPRGTDPSAIAMRRFIVCIQNHDQVGNRAFGDRLNHVVDEATWRAVSAVLLLAPMTPLLFMGQEWAASTPFCYFTDHEPGLGQLVTDGRRREFAAFPAFADAETAARIPDPQAPGTFEQSQLQWSERSQARHARSLALYRALLELRHAHAALGADDASAGDATAAGEAGVVIRRAGGDGAFWIFCLLRGAGSLEAPVPETDDGTGFDVVLSTEDARFAEAPRPPTITRTPGGVAVRFERPGALVLRVGTPETAA